jgi:hypothetical protein
MCLQSPLRGGAMSKIVVRLPKDRNYTGILRFENDKGQIELGPFLCIGRASDLAASDAGNHSRLPLLRFGDTPTGVYKVRGIVESGPGSPYDSVLYGSEGIVLLQPTSGDAALAEANGRFLLAIHGGRTAAQRRLRSTNGCIRMYDHDLSLLIGRLVWEANVTCECAEVIEFPTALYVGVDATYNEGDPFILRRETRRSQPTSAERVSPSGRMRETLVGVRNEAYSSTSSSSRHSSSSSSSRHSSSSSSSPHSSSSSSSPHSSSSDSSPHSSSSGSRGSSSPSDRPSSNISSRTSDSSSSSREIDSSGSTPSSSISSKETVPQ